jgi:pimeloyl-ACP methyl ester carboxylesterase
VKISAIAVIALACLIALVLVSYAVEALRPRPRRPDKLPWGPGIPIEYANLGDIRVRYIKTGSGPNLVLLHTLRTQLDIFQKVIPELARHFTVTAYDYPGHGWSDIPRADYAPEDFYRWTAAFLDALGIEQACLAGISIGGTVALVLAARGNPRVDRAIAINPYDYWPAGGIRKSSVMARLILEPSGVPILGATLMRLRNRFVSDRIMEGGVASAQALPQDLKKELYEVGARPGHTRGFLSLLAHERLWPQARNEYPRIRIPTLLVYGDRDWAPAAMREQERALIPEVSMTTIPDGGHFLSLDRPEELAGLMVRFIANTRGPRAARV